MELTPTINLDNVAVPDGLVGYWLAPGHTSPKLGTVRDLSAEHNEASMFGDAYINNDGLNLDGLNDYASVFNSTIVPSSYQNLGNNNGFFISCWIKVPPDGGAGGAVSWAPAAVIVELRTQKTSGTHVPFSFGISYPDGVGNGGVMSLGRTDNYISTDEIKDSNVALDDSKWHYACASVNNNTVSFFVDSVFDSEQTYTISTGDTSVGSGTSNLFVGIRTKDNGDIDTANCFDGILSDLRIYNRALSSSEVREIYDSTKWKHQNA